jgi:hypothetical protein
MTTETKAKEADMKNEADSQMDLMLRSHTERCLQEIWEQPELHTDDDGDYPFRYGTAICWVRVSPAPQQEVRVFAHAAHGVKRTAKLLAEINDINVRARWVTVSLQDGFVVVTGALHWTAINRPALAELMSAASHVADDIGSMIAAVHGGATPFEPSDDELAEPGEAA